MSLDHYAFVLSYYGVDLARYTHVCDLVDYHACASKRATHSRLAPIIARRTRAATDRAAHAWWQNQPQKA